MNGILNLSSEQNIKNVYTTIKYIYIYIKRNIYIHAEIIPPLLIWVLTIAFCSRLSARSNILLFVVFVCFFSVRLLSYSVISHWRDAMRSKAKVNKERKHEERYAFSDVFQRDLWFNIGMNAQILVLTHIESTCWKRMKKIM